MAEGKRGDNELQIKFTAVKLSLSEAQEENLCLNSLNTHLLQAANDDKVREGEMCMVFLTFFLNE